MTLASPCFDVFQSEPPQLAKLQKLSLDDKILYSSDLCIPTIDHRGGKGGHLNIADGEIVRVITEREAWRFMGFDDERIDRAFAVEPSRSKRYKAAGNSIAVPVLMEIFRKMFLDIPLTVQRSLDDWEVKA